MKKKVRINIKGTRYFSSRLTENLPDGEGLFPDESVLSLQDEGEFASSAETGDEKTEYPIDIPEGLSDAEIVALLKQALNEITESSPTTELDTQGEMTYDDGVVTLTYDESEITGMAGSRTTIRMEKNGVASFSRSGRINSHMVFENKKRYFCISGDNAGEIPVCISTNNLKSSLNEHGGELFIDYCVEVGGSKAEHSEFEIKVR